MTPVLLENTRMGPDEALRLANHVKGLYPETTSDLVTLLCHKFAQFDKAVVESEIDSFRSRFEILHVSNLLRRIADEQQRRAPGNQHDEEKRELEAERQREEAALAKLSPEQWNKEKEAILEANPDLRTFLANKDPRKSVMLRALILDQRLKKI